MCLTPPVQPADEVRAWYFKVVRSNGFGNVFKFNFFALHSYLSVIYTHTNMRSHTLTLTNVFVLLLSLYPRLGLLLRDLSSLSPLLKH